MALSFLHSAEPLGLKSVLKLMSFPGKAELLKLHIFQFK